MTSCTSMNNEIIYQVENNDKTQKAILSVCPGSFNVGDSYRVFILYSNENLDDYGIVFIANDWDNVLPRDTSKIKLNWIDSKTLKINFDKKLRIIDQRIKTRDNVIVYGNIENKEKK